MNSLSPLQSQLTLLTFRKIQKSKIVNYLYLIQILLIKFKGNIGILKIFKYGVYIWLQRGVNIATPPSIVNIILYLPINCIALRELCFRPCLQSLISSNNGRLLTHDSLIKRKKRVGTKRRYKRIFGHTWNWVAKQFIWFLFPCVIVFTYQLTVSQIDRSKSQKK